MQDGRGTVQGDETSEAAGLDVAVKFETSSMMSLDDLLLLHP